MTEINSDIDQTVSINTTDTVQQVPSVEDLQEQIADISDKYLRKAAEIENLRRRFELDAQNMARARVAAVVENFLPLIDAVDAALKHSPKDEGIIAMANAINAALEKSGIIRIETIGKMMNPSFHNVVSMIDTNGESPSNSIVEELQTGYMFGDTVLRSAMVVVAK